MRAVIHTKSICPYCQMAKTYLSNHGIPYEELLYDEDMERQLMYDRLGLQGTQRTVPQIFLVEGSEQRWIGGYNDLVRNETLERFIVGDFNEEF